MTIARSKQFEPESIGLYHCISRCVRKAYLCGYDAVLEKSFEHRREIISRRLVYLSKIFAIDHMANAILSNHIHLVLRNRPDKIIKLSDYEIAKRWLLLYPKKSLYKDIYNPPESIVNEIVEDTNLIKTYRERLSSISWYMKSINEYIARIANKEDDCTGRFWEGRFKCKKIKSSAALLACCVYVDLNPIRAGESNKIEDIKYSSIRIRIEELKNDKNKPSKKDLELVSIEELSNSTLTTKEYIELVDQSARLIKENKGYTPNHFAPVLERINIKPDSWVDIITKLEIMFKRVIGNSNDLLEEAIRTSNSWVQGKSAAKIAFI